MVLEQHQTCRPEVLLQLLHDTLKEAECCDALIAIHVATALARYHDVFGTSDQSSER